MTMTVAASSITMPCTSSTSRFEIAWNTSRPRPGSENTFSTTIVPVLTVMGLQFANLVTGTIVVENVFSLPGLGRLIFQAISNRDVLLVQGIVMLLAATVIVINFVVDVLYAVIDPRLKVHAA